MVYQQNFAGTTFLGFPKNPEKSTKMNPREN